MPQTSADEQDLFKWKEKYFDSLDEMEKLEKEMQAQIGLVSKGLIHISRLAKGHDHKLDKTLSDIRDALQNDRFDSNLKRLLMSLRDIVTAAKSNQYEIREKIANSLQLSINQLHDLNIPSAIKKKLRNYSKSLDQRIENFDNHPQLINEFTDFHNQVIQQFTQETDSEKGLLGRLFKNNKTDAPPQENNQAAKRAYRNQFTEINSEQLDLDSNQNSTLPAPSVPDNSSPESEKIIMILNSLISNTGVARTFYDKATKLQQKINQENDINKLVNHLDEITTLLFASLNIDQKEIQQYLNTVNERLNEIKDFLDTTQQDHEISDQSSLTLTKDVQAQVKKIHSDITSTNDIKILKKSINHNLDGIVNTINHFHIEESKRKSSLSDQLHGLIGRVQQMESESQQIWDKLEEHKQRALEDPLTKLPNRSAYNEYLKSEFARWKRYQTPLSIAIGDIDLFKQINDKYGHLAGDKVLQVASKIMLKALRETDFIARFGGEEFVVVLPNTAAKDALHAIEKIRISLKDCPFHYQKAPVNITISFGVTSFNDSDTVETALQRADEALYKAKEQGRNQSKLAV